MSRTVLILPGGTPEGLRHARLCRELGLATVGASSLAADPARHRYDRWRHLPNVGDPAFPAALARAVQETGIDAVYTSHPVIWDYLDGALATLAPGVRLLSPAPLTAAARPYREAAQAVAAYRARPLDLALASRPALPERELVALLQHAEAIPGMCAPDKTLALSEIVRTCPAGDVVEIGSWWGKSAFVLLRLARLFGLGPVLCVDPWSDAHLGQQDGAGPVDAMAARLDADQAFRIFLSHLLPYAAGDLNYLRMASVEAARWYRGERDVASDEFGETRYQGRIGLLHIDGNHAEAQVAADLEAWGGLLADGGWIVFDDYQWAFGDGPRRVADAFLAARRGRLDATFVAGGALFAKLSHPD